MPDREFCALGKGSDQHPGSANIDPAVSTMMAFTTSPYLELLKRTLIGHANIGTQEHHPLAIVQPTWKTAFLHPLDRILRTRNFAIMKLKPVVREKRLNGYDWPAQAETMIGLGRLNNIEYCIRSIVADGVPGDLMETGVWRGGATILMRAVLRDMSITDRKVWVADSFEGLPAPDTVTYPDDTGSRLHELRILTASLEEVRNNFAKYDLLDEQVVFLKGWFKETLPKAPIDKLSLLRLDGDMYGSTMEALVHLYPKLSRQGFVIVDDYHAFAACKKATDEYRMLHRIVDPIIDIDKEAVYWRKTG